MRIVSALCLMLISTGCHANDIMQGHWESSRPSAGRKANGHFGANMVLTASESQVRRDWVKYKANPRIPLVKNVSKGTPVSALVVFHGCTPDRAGYCQVEAQYALRTPTGDTKQLGRSVIWNGLPGRYGQLQLGYPSLSVMPSIAGPYVVQARLVDKVSRKELNLSQTLYAH